MGCSQAVFAPLLTQSNPGRMRLDFPTLTFSTITLDTIGHSLSMDTSETVRGTQTLVFIDDEGKCIAGYRLAKATLEECVNAGRCKDGLNIFSTHWCCHSLRNHEGANVEMCGTVKSHWKLFDRNDKCRFQHFFATLVFEEYVPDQ